MRKGRLQAAFLLPRLMGRKNFRNALDKAAREVVSSLC